MFEEADAVARVFELVDVRPNFSLPAFLVHGRLATGRTAGVQADGSAFDADRRGTGQFDENAADFLDFFVHPEQVLVTQQIPESQLFGLNLASVRVWNGPYSARSCSVESHAIQKVSLYAIAGFAPGSRSRLLAAEPAVASPIVIVQFPCRPSTV